MYWKRKLLLVVMGFVALVMAPLPVFAQDLGLCGSLNNSFGPFDYRYKSSVRTELGDAHKMVEGAHFTADVEQLIRGKSMALPGGDIDYTLRAFPNHHRALLSMSRLALRAKSDQPPDMRYTATCWFERAMRFAPDDGMVRMLYGQYLLKVGKQLEAIEHLEAAEKLTEGSANLHYNLGLAFIEVKRYDDARRHARKAYALGFPLAGLRERLKRLGQWKD
ncbi:CDC27 family protein [Thauera sp. JM12B12]|uniref:CDC27 family protein n=1 Tax=Thauera sp. JM12B12 TaxID=3142262 RepID=UPI0031F424FD